MSAIAIFHDRLDLFGGGEAVCAAAIEALQGDHEVTVFTRQCPDFDTVNDYFGTAVRAAEVSVVTAADAEFQRWLAGVGGLTESTLGLGLQSLRRAAFVRWVESRTRDRDLVLSTSGEHPFAPPTVVYYHKHDEPARGALDRARRAISTSLTGSLDPTASDVTVLANSQWTANRVAADYGIEPTVVYPPVDTRDLRGGAAWEAREPGFVTVGRIEPVKNVLQTMEVVTELVDRGHDVHQHVVGPPQDGRYQRRVERRAAEHDFLHVEGRVPRTELVGLLGSHRYGLHGRSPEHFGIAVAEMVASGMLPFVPDSGGQREVVGELDPLLFGSVSEAVDAIEAVLSDETEQHRLRATLPDVESSFGHDRFKRRLATVVASVLSEDPVGERPEAVP